MRKIKRVKRLVVSTILAGAAVGVPAVGFMPSAVMAAEADSINLNVKQREGGVVSSSAYGTVKSGETFTLNAQADDGYRFAYWILRSDGYHEIVSGSETEANISVRVNESDSRLFTAEAVFVENDTHIVRNQGVLSYAKTGDKIDVSKYEEYSYNYEDEDAAYFGHTSFNVYRANDDVDVTDDVLDKDSMTVTMPDFDINISYEKLIGSYSKVLDEIEVEDDTFSIENATGDIARLPESAKAGDEVEIATVQDDGDSVIASYRIERISDGADMTGTLMIAGAQNRFIMPYYDIRVVADTWVSENTGEINASGGVSEELSAEESAKAAVEFEEKVLAEYFSSEEAATTETVSESKDSDELKGVTESKEELVGLTSEVEAVAVENTGEKVSVRNEAFVSENEPESVKVGVVSEVAAPEAASVKVAERVQPAAVSIASATPVYSPAAIRAEGANSTTVSSVSAPATGDYNSTGAVTFAAIAEGAGIVAAAGIMIRSRKAD